MRKRAYIWCSVRFKEETTSKNIGEKAEVLNKIEKVLGSELHFDGVFWEMEMVNYHWERGKLEQLREAIKGYEGIIDNIEAEVYYLERPDEVFDFSE